MNIEGIKEKFPVKKFCLYFNFASDGPLPASSKAAIIDALEEKTNTGMIAIPKQVAVYEDLRDQLSILFKSPSSGIVSLKKRLEEKKVIVSLRSGYIRAAFHLVPDLEEVERFVDIL